MINNQPDLKPQFFRASRLTQADSRWHAARACRQGKSREKVPNFGFPQFRILQKAFCLQIDVDRMRSKTRRVCLIKPVRKRGSFKGLPTFRSTDVCNCQMIYSTNSWWTDWQANRFEVMPKSQHLNYTGRSGTLESGKFRPLSRPYTLFMELTLPTDLYAQCSYGWLISRVDKR